MLGIARFSYTPILPLMQSQTGLSLSDGGWLATFNYTGYLLGAVLASLINNLQLKDQLFRTGLLVAVLTTAGMGLTENFWLWSILRFFSGLSSAAGLLLGSGLIMHWLIHNEYKSELGLHFSGMGLGIFLPTLFIVVFNPYLEWQQLWILLAMIGLLLLIPSWLWLPKPVSDIRNKTAHQKNDTPPSSGYLRIFMMAYFCAGVGYVVSATFIVAIVDGLPTLQGNGNLAFMLLGIGAAPACIIWDKIARAYGDTNALIIAWLLKILAIYLTTYQSNTYLVLIGATLFGATFIGIVSLVLSISGRYYPDMPAKMMGKMTISYGVAQIIAPAITGMLAEYFSGSYLSGLYLAMAVMALGAVFMLVLKWMEFRGKQFA